MRIGIALPTSTLDLGPSMLVDISKAAEALGYDSLWTLDRILWAVKPRNPYSGRYDPWPESFRYTSDPLDLLGFIAARTERINLGTSVINAPYYNPVQLARRLTTIDVLSQGRLKVGLGLGWSEDEFEASGVSMARRGDRMDEFLQVLDAVWTQEPSSYQGEFYSLPEAVFDLKPVQKPRPALILGTSSTRGLIRAGRAADGWNPVGSGADQIRKMAAVMRQAAEEAGRDPDTLQIVLRTGIDLRPKAASGERRPLSGSLEQIAQDIVELADAGVTELFTGAGEIRAARGQTVQKYINQLETLSVILSRGLGPNFCDRLSFAGPNLGYPGTFYWGLRSAATAAIY